MPHARHSEHTFTITIMPDTKNSLHLPLDELKTRLLEGECADIWFDAHLHPDERDKEKTIEVTKEAMGMAADLCKELREHLHMLHRLVDLALTSPCGKDAIRAAEWLKQLQ